MPIDLSHSRLYTFLYSYFQWTHTPFSTNNKRVFRYELQCCDDNINSMCAVYVCMKKKEK